MGEFSRGWELYESRFSVIESHLPAAPFPRWKGEQLAGKTILICAEQGFGDAIQCARYFPILAAQGARPILQCHSALADLLGNVRGVAGVTPLYVTPRDVDFCVSTFSLPGIFKTTPESIPWHGPYLSADHERRLSWQRRLGTTPQKLRVGLAWSGHPQHRRTATRDIRLTALRPILGMEDIEFFSLQIGHGAEQIQEHPGSSSIADYAAQIQNFADTAALVMELDLIISVDTAVAHLAGALGKPVWTLLPFVPDWRWGLEGETTPWYPTMQLFRQPKLGDWDSVIQRVAEELKKLAETMP